MSQSNMEIVRRFVEVVNTSTSVEEAIATGVEEFWDPEIEFVNPEDAIEGGIRKGAGGMRTALENSLAGLGVGMTVEIEMLEEKGDRVFSIVHAHARGDLSGVEVIGRPFAQIYTFRDGRLLRYEWHNDIAEARAIFEQDH